MSHHRIWTGCIGNDGYEVMERIKKENKDYNPVLIVDNPHRLDQSIYM